MGVATTKFVWMDGELVRWKNAKVHIMTHALHYGSSVFEGLHSYKTSHGAAIFRLNDHLERFFQSANALSMDIKFTKKELENAVKNLVKINKINNGYVRPLAYYGYGPVGIFPKSIPTNVALVAMHWGNYYSKNLRIASI